MSVIPSRNKDLIPDSIARMPVWQAGPATLGILIVLLFSLSSLSPGLSSDGSISSPQWIKVSMPAKLESHQAITVQVGDKEFLYLIGGKEPGISLSNKVYFAQLGPGRALGGWTATLPIYHTAGLQEHSAVAVGNRIYVLGGRGNSWQTFDSVYCAEPDAAGRISDWILVDTMPTGLTLHTVVTVDNVVFVMGGYNSQLGRFVNEVWAADITGGSCTSLQWRSHPEEPLRDRLAAHSAAAVRLGNGRKFIYVTGGYDGTAYRLVWRAEVDDSGTLTPWVSLGEISPAPRGFFRHVSAISGRYLYVIGGTVDGDDQLNAIYRARIKDDGSLEPWSTLDVFPVSVFNHAAAVSALGRIYVLGGNADSGILDWGYFTALLDFEKSASPTGAVTYGDTIDYTLKLTNLGVRDLERILITDTVETSVPTGFEFQDLPCECQACSSANDTITCTIPNLDLGKTKDLHFGVAFPRPTLEPAPTATSTPHTSWTQERAQARLEARGVGISDSSPNTLRIPSPETIASESIRVQVALKISGTVGGETLAEVIFCSGDTCYPPLTEPTSIDDFMAVYEQDVQVSDVISVTVVPLVDDVHERALTAYFLRSTAAWHTLFGQTMNHALCHDVYTQVLPFPFPVYDGHVIVQAVIADNDNPDRSICLTAQAGGKSGDEICFSKPSHGNYLDIREFRLSSVPEGTTEVTVVVQSPPEDGESVGLIGLTAETNHTLRVVNRAEVCEVVGSGQWCVETSYINTDLRIYLPIVLRNAP